MNGEKDEVFGHYLPCHQLGFWMEGAAPFQVKRKIKGWICWSNIGLMFFTSSVFLSNLLLGEEEDFQKKKKKENKYWESYLE